MAAPSPTRPERILVGCPPEEHHTFSPLLLALLLRRRGWEALYLGANVPLARMEVTITAIRPQLVMLSAQRLHTAATLLEMARLLQGQRVPLAFGGRVFNLLPALPARIPGYFLGERLDLAPQAVEQVRASPPPLPAVEAPSEPHRRASSHYRERWPLIEARVWQAMAPAATLDEHMTIANWNFASNVAAALALGDMDFVEIDIAWVKGLLHNFNLPTELLQRYLRAYYQAARACLDERGAPIVSWLARMSDEIGD